MPRGANQVRARGPANRGQRDEERIMLGGERRKSVSTTTVLWREGLHFCSELASGRLMCDESSEVGKAYPSAPELLMASLGSCIGSVLATFAERHEIDLEGMRIGLEWEIAERPHRIGGIDIRVSVPAELSEERRATLERVAHACLIHNTLTHPPDIRLALESGG
jgi:uncharacterized OsmC-like protein